VPLIGKFSIPEPFQSSQTHEDVARAYSQGLGATVLF
jgi:hypothetical protein